MRRVAQLVLMLFLGCLGCPSAWATWTCAEGASLCTTTTQRGCADATGTGSCNITVGSTVAHSIEVLVGSFSNVSTLLSSTSDGTWTCPAGSHGTVATPGGTNTCYNLNATGGATTITCTFSTPVSGEQCLWARFTITAASGTFDTSSAVADTTCTSCNGVALTLGTANNYLLIQGTFCAQTCSAITQYTGSTFLNGNGLAYKINVAAAGTTPVWTQAPTGVVAVGAIAIYETPAAGGVAIPNKQRRYDRVDDL